MGQISNLDPNLKAFFPPGIRSKLLLILSTSWSTTYALNECGLILGKKFNTAQIVHILVTIRVLMMHHIDVDQFGLKKTVHIHS